MQIYVEYLFAENFITGVIIIYLTGKLCSHKILKKRLIFGGIACGGISFIILLEDMGAFWSVLIKLSFAVCIVAFTYKLKNKKTIIKTGFIFFLITFTLGGITIGSMYLGGYKGISNNAFVYTEMIGYGQIIIGIVIGILFMETLIIFLKNTIYDNKVYKEVLVEIKQNIFRYKGYVDTGNSLRDPITGKPVAIIGGKAASVLKEKSEEDRYCIIPYHAIGKASGYLEGIRTDKVTINGIEHKNMVIAIYMEEFEQNPENNYEILLHKDSLRGGLLANG